MHILNEKFRNKSLINSTNGRSLEIENFNKNNTLQRKYLRKGQLKHYPSSIKEWYNSIYVFKKDNFFKILPLKDKILYKLFDIYFNKFKDYKCNSLSMNKIFIGKPEIKHFSNKVNITLYIFNKWIAHLYNITEMTKTSLLIYKLNGLIEKNLFILVTLLLKHPISNILVNIVNKKLSVKLLYDNFYTFFNSIGLYKASRSSRDIKVVDKSTFKRSMFNIKTKRYLYLYLYLVYCFFDHIKLPKVINILKKVSFSFKEKRFTNLNIILRNLGKIYLKKLRINSSYLLMKLINLYLITSKLLKDLYLLKWYKRNIFLSLYAFNIRNILILKNFLNKLYDKRIQINIINLKYLHLDGNILALAIAKKLKNRKRRVLRVIRMALRLSKKPQFIKFYSNFLNINSLDSMVIRKNFNLSLYNDNIPLNKDLMCKPVSYKSRLIFYYLNNKIVSGIKLQGAGRLTKRLTASRSISKAISKGSLKNRISSYNGLSTVVLRGYVKSNLQYISINSYNRIGAYGIKNWISNF
jgi:hypothetical protein